MGEYQSNSSEGSIRMFPIIKLKEFNFQPVCIPLIALSWSCDNEFIMQPVKSIKCAPLSHSYLGSNVPFMSIDSVYHSQK